MSSQEEIPPKSPTMEVDEETKPQIKASVATQVNANSPTKPRSPKLFTAPTNNNGPSPTTPPIPTPKPTYEMSSVIDESKNRIDDPYFQSFPPGYRFAPLDEELVVDYLKKKVLNQRLPHNRIMDVNLYHYNPEDLAAKYKQCGEKEWYFFTPRERKYRNGNRPNRGADDGYWKATGADKSIKFNGHTVGFRKALVYYKGKPPKGDKTNWIMHEYRVNDSPRKKKSVNDMTLDDWVLCRIYKKADKSIKTRQRDDDHSALAHHDETNEHMGMDCDYNNVVDSTGYANKFGDYMHQTLQNGLPQCPQVSNIPLGDIAKVNDQLQELSVNFGTCTKMVEPNCFKPPPMHSQEGIFGSKYLNENLWSGTKPSGLQDDIWSIQNLENCDFGSQYFNNAYMEPMITLDNILPINAPNDPPTNPSSSLSR